jgi:energy-converting hydrogenase A subunit M
VQLQELRKKFEQQESDLRRLRLQLGESRMAQGDVVRGFQELIQVQGEQFREVTESFSRFLAGQPPKK